MNDETEEAKIVEVEEDVIIDESQPAIVDVTGNETEATGEPVSQGLSEEELDKRRDKTQKRINKLVAQRKESEEREAAALQFAQQQKTEADALRGQLSSLNTGYSAEASSRIDSQESQAKAAFKEAYEAGEVDKMADAQQVMAKIAIEKERLRIFKGNQEKQQQVRQAQQQYQQQPGAQQQVQQQQEYAPPPQPDAKATDWAERDENSW
jgi:chromosome segregation ATPase